MVGSALVLIAPVQFRHVVIVGFAPVVAWPRIARKLLVAWLLDSLRVGDSFAEHAELLPVDLLLVIGSCHVIKTEVSEIIGDHGAVLCPGEG
jgi:hypothetical protein